MRLNGPSQSIRLSRTTRYFAVAALSALSTLLIANPQSRKLPPGLQSFTPTRIDWLATTLQASLRDDEMQTRGFQLEVAYTDPDTILIYVRYLPDVNRTVMNSEIDTARQVIGITVKSYGWDKWVQVREDVQPAKLESK